MFLIIQATARQDDPSRLVIEAFIATIAATDTGDDVRCVECDEPATVMLVSDDAYPYCDRDAATWRPYSHGETPLVRS